MVLDGAGDRPHPQYQNQTPLQAARMPFLDGLVKQGITGQIKPIRPGLAPESDEAVLALLGYNAVSFQARRGPLEALGVNYQPKSKVSFLALRANFATSSDGKQILDRRAGRTLSLQDNKQLCQTLNEKIQLPVTVRILPGVGHRAVVIFEGSTPFSQDVTNTDPAYTLATSGWTHAEQTFRMKRKQSRPLKHKKTAQISANLINLFSNQVFPLLKNHPSNQKRKLQGKPPANLLLLRDAGITIPKLTPKRKGWSIIANMPLEIGIGRAAGMKICNTPQTAVAQTNYPNYAKQATTQLRAGRSVYVHLKGPDLFGHEKDFEGKVKSLEEIDRYFFQSLTSNLTLTKTQLIVTADHATPCTLGGHSSDSVPLLVVSPKLQPDGTTHLDENQSARGRLNKIRALSLFKRFCQPK